MVSEDSSMSIFSGTSISKMSLEQVLSVVVVIILVMILVLMLRYISEIKEDVVNLNDIYDNIISYLNSARDSVNSCISSVNSSYKNKLDELDDRVYSVSELKSNIKRLSDISSQLSDSMTYDVIDNSVKEASNHINNAIRLSNSFLDESQDMFLDKRSPIRIIALDILDKKTLDIYHKYKYINNMVYNRD